MPAFRGLLHSAADAESCCAQVYERLLAVPPLAAPTQPEVLQPA
jgi:hypothetical protein